MSIYIQKVSEIALSNKYTKWYLNICSKANIRSSNRKEAKELLGYVEGHHILPKGFKIGGETDKTNIVFLSAREHYVVHWLATKMFKETYKAKMYYAFSFLVNASKFLIKNSYMYDLLKKCNSYDKVGIPLSEEHKEKLENLNQYLDQNVKPIQKKLNKK